MIYRVVMLNGRFMDFEAEEVCDEEETYKFYDDDEVVAEFSKKNIAGYVDLGEEEEEE